VVDDRDRQSRNSLEVLESIYDALDQGDPELALRLAREERAGAEEDDPVLRFLTGLALADLDRPIEAATELSRAVELDPDDAEFRVELAYALFRSCRFDDAREHADRAARLDDRLADAHVVQGLLLERDGALERADACFRRAAGLDPERFPEPRRIAWETFDEEIERAREHLPPPFREHLEQVGLLVEDLPSEALLFEESPPLDPELLGLFAGVPIGQESNAGGELPPRIYLFKRNLERLSPPDALPQEIADTLYHELGHYLGFDEDELEELDFA